VPRGRAWLIDGLQFFGAKKGSGDAGDLLASCAFAADMPEYVRTTLAAIALVVEPLPAAAGIADAHDEKAGAAQGGAAGAAGVGQAALVPLPPLPPLPVVGPASADYKPFVPHPPKPKP